MFFKFKKSSGKTGFFAWKIDLSKAYDRPREALGKVALSSYIFVLCVEKLSHLIQSAIDYGYWKAVKASQSGPKILHLFFADDLILFVEASSQQTSLLKTCLDNFCALSRHTVSFEKSLVFCSPNTSNSTASLISNVCGSPLTCDLGKYLVTSAIPMYAMQTAKFHVNLCDKLDKLNRDFILSDVENKKRVHLVNWDTICQPKYLGGLGVKKTADINQAMLSKIGWRIFQHDNGLWANVLYAKYLQHGCLFGNDYKPPSDVSSTWRGVMHGAKLIKKNLKWRVRNGNSIKFCYTMHAWKKPPENFFKLNVDGTRVSLIGKIGAGGVIRNHHGDWISGFQINLGVGEILDAEAWGLFQGLKLAVSLNIKNLIIESDSAILVQLMNNSEFGNHPFGSLL
ncbi:hypothetical protein ACLB2K_055750 [Fragaria x ananassa]